MRINLKPTPKIGDKRLKDCYAWFPVEAFTSYGKRYLIWLEPYKLEQEYKESSSYDGYTGVVCSSYESWETIKRYI